jgi:hypothetical protein
MQATRHRSNAHPEALADSIAGKLRRGRDDEACKVGK